MFRNKFTKSFKNMIRFL